MKLGERERYSGDDEIDGGTATYLLVLDALPVDEEVAAFRQLGRWHLAHAHPAEAAALLRQPAAARVIPCHDHRFDAHNVTVTADTHRANI